MDRSSKLCIFFYPGSIHLIIIANSSNVLYSWNNVLFYNYFPGMLGVSRLST